ncbi:MAG TPA: ATP-binding cassette domain-containing protein [Gemmatimonadales bacterium]|nr:ATP-binding cassette domain-containing protein [Gemmatimonadales bacterium]
MIELVDVHKAFGPREILRGLSLEIPKGRNTVIIGYSGTGKSVLLKCIIGLLKPDSGEVRVDGAVVGTMDADELAALRGKVGYVFQSAALFDSMTVNENIALGLRRRQLPPDEIDRRIEESLAVVDLSDAGEKRPSELSGGMRKRVGVARAIALRPDYVLYDEPTTGLDPVTSAVMDQLMMRTRDLGVTGVIVTHDMRTAFTVGDRVAMLYEGVIRQVGTGPEMRESSDAVVRQFIEGRPDAALSLRRPEP